MSAKSIYPGGAKNKGDYIRKKIEKSRDAVKRGKRDQVKKSPKKK